ncbi:unnamed protein product [Calicophoron daubneyi]|uniref:Uncharacterized protein n=1 Tax=Calicophoron daubneyi TaxID=300641 RepID=A0AAV2TI71_CALDB
MLEGSSVSRGVKNGNVCSRNESIQLKYMELMHHFAGGNSSNWNSMAKEAVHSLFLKGYQRSRAPGKTKNTKEKTQKKPSNTSNAAVRTEGDKCDHNANNIVDTNKSTGDEEFHTAREDSSGIPISGVQTVGDRSPKFLFNDLPSPEGNLLHCARLGDRPIKVKIQMKPGMGSLAPTRKIANQINSRQGGTQEGGATLGIPKMVERNRTGVHKTTKPYPECQRFHDEKVMDWLSVEEKHIREANRRKRVEERAKRQADYAAEVERKRRAELATVAFEEWLNRKTKPTEAKKRHRVAAVLRVSRKAQKAQKDSPPSGPLELHVPAWKSNGDMEQSDQEKEGTSISLVPLKAHPEHPHTQVAQAKTTLVECPPVRQIKQVTGRPRETTVEHATTLKMTTLQPQVFYSTQKFVNLRKRSISHLSGTNQSR